MVDNLDRRNFLTLKKTIFRRNRSSEGAWELFLERVQRVTHLKPRILANSPQGASVVVTNLAELPILVDLCASYEVVLLQGLHSDQIQNKQEPCLARAFLEVQLEPSINQCEQLNTTTVLAQPCVTTGYLLDRGFEQFLGVPPYTPLWLWLAQSKWHDCRPGYTYTSGLERVHAMFGDGKSAVLGGFDVDDCVPLNRPMLHTAIPQLFELLQQGELQEVLQKWPCWPFQYRVDALSKTVKGSSINLARLVLGHQGTLIIPMEMVISQRPRVLAEIPEWEPTPKQQELIYLQSTLVDSTLKGLLDEFARFPFLDEIRTL